MTKLFRNDSPGALTLEQARDREIKREGDRRRQAQLRRQARELAEQGRGDDTEIAHVARGELVIPEVLQSPELLAALEWAAAAHALPLEALRVGSIRNSINPATGTAEFGMFDGFTDRIKNAYGQASDQIGKSYSKYFGGSDPNLPQPVATMVPRPSVNEGNVPPSYAELGFDPNGPKLGRAILHDPVAGLVGGVTGLLARQQAISRFGGGDNNASNSFQHSRWNQMLSNVTSPERAKAITDAYERTFETSDPTRLMDLHNNHYGRVAPPDTDLQSAINQGYLRTRPFR